MVIFFLLGEEMKAKTEKPAPPVPTPVRNTCLPDSGFAGPDDETQPGEVPKDLSVSRDPADSWLGDLKNVPESQLVACWVPCTAAIPILGRTWLRKWCPRIPFWIQRS